MTQYLFEKSLFKAKKLDSNEFVEGNLIVYENGCFISEIDCFESCDENVIEHDILQYDTEKIFDIDKECIGQYFGKVDLKLNKIFSNIDIFEFYKRINDDKEIHGIGYFVFDYVNLCYVVKQLYYYNDRVYQQLTLN